MDKTPRLTLSVVIPAYNEAGRLPATLRALADVIKKGGMLPLEVKEVIISDDGSTDGSAGTAEAFRSCLPELKIVRSGRNAGKGGAVRAGFAQARGNWVLAADADMSTPWGEAARLAGVCAARSAVVAIGSRGLAESRILVHQSFVRENLGKLFNLFVRVLTRLPYKDTQCGFKLFQKRAVEKIVPGLKVDGFAWDVEFLAACRGAGLGIEEVPVTWENSAESRVRIVSGGFEMLFSLFRIALGNIRVSAFLAAASFFAPLAAYTLTLAPAVFWQDSGIYLAAAAEFGIPYPPGFPIYVILTALAGLIPIGTFAQRVHFVSALAAAGTCLVVYLTVLRLGEQGRAGAGRGQSSAPDEEKGFLQPAAAFIVALGAGFSFALWSQAVNSEVYSLHAFITALIIYRLLRLEESPAPALWPLALAAGIGFANHPMIVGMLPVLVYAFWKHKRNWRAWLKVLPVFMLAGLLPYAYFPFRSMANPLTDWGNPETFAGFLRVVMASHWTAETASYSFFGDDFWKRVAELLRLFFLQFGPAAIALGLLGGAVLRKTRGFFFRCLELTAGFALLIPLFYRQTQEFESWFIPAYIVFAIAVGEGTFRVIRLLRSRWPARPRLPGVFLFALALAYPCLLVVIALPAVDRSRDWDAEDYAANILRGVGENGILLISGDNPSSVVLAAQAASGLRRDVAAVNIDALWAPWYRGHVRDNLRLPSAPLRDMASGAELSVGDYAMALIRGNPDRPAYILLPGRMGDQEGLRFSPSGMVFRAAPTAVKEPASRWDLRFHDPRALYRDRRPDQRRVVNETRHEMFLGYLRAYTTGGDEFFGRGDFKTAAGFYAQAAALAPGREDLRLRWGVCLAQLADYRGARGIFEELVRIMPGSHQGYYNLGNVLGELGDREGARKAYLKALELAPDFEPARTAMATLRAE